MAELMEGSQMSLLMSKITYQCYIFMMTCFSSLYQCSMFIKLLVQCAYRIIQMNFWIITLFCMLWTLSLFTLGHTTRNNRKQVHYCPLTFPNYQSIIIFHCPAIPDHNDRSLPKADAEATQSNPGEPEKPFPSGPRANKVWRLKGR